MILQLGIEFKEAYELLVSAWAGALLNSLNAWPQPGLVQPVHHQAVCTNLTS